MGKNICVLLMAVMVFATSCQESSSAEVPTPNKADKLSTTFLKKKKSRSLKVSYTATISDVPVGTRFLNVWIPLPIESDLQEVKDLKIDAGTARYQVTQDSFYGNRMVYLHILKPGKNLKVDISFKLRRWEDFPAFSRERKLDIPWELTILPTTNSPMNPTIRERVEAMVIGKTEKEDRIRLLFEQSLKFLTPDLKNTQQGNYDKVFSAARGDSQDYQVYLATHCRNLSMPYFNEYGVVIPDNDEGKLSESLTWGYYRIDKSWYPVDCFTADKVGGDQAGYYCGNLDENRISFSRGRNVSLVPQQKDAVIDGFVAPHAEVDGKKFGGVSYEMTYEEDDF